MYYNLCRVHQTLHSHLQWKLELRVMLGALMNWLAFCGHGVPKRNPGNSQLDENPSGAMMNVHI
jgi:hypothetical protein